MRDFDKRDDRGFERRDNNRGYDRRDRGYDGGDRDEVYSKKVRAGKRTYFFDVKATRSGDFYLTLTESKKRLEDGVFTKTKLFLYKEDFEKFVEGLQDAMTYVRSNQEVVERRYEDRPFDEEGRNNSAASAAEPTPAPKSDDDFNFEI